MRGLITANLKVLGTYPNDNDELIIAKRGSMTSGSSSFSSLVGIGNSHITVSDIVLASSHTSLILFLVISDWRSRTSLAPAWITILLNFRLVLASTFKFAKMSGALAPGKQWTMVAGVSIFTFRTIESP